MYIADFDEIHAKAEGYLEAYRTKRKTEEEIRDEILELLILLYLDGRRSARKDLDYWDSADIAYIIEEFPDDALVRWFMRNLPEDLEGEQIRRMMDVIMRTLEDGKNVDDRIREHLENGDAGRLAVTIDSESHRDYEEGAYSIASEYEKKTGASVLKTWNTMLDDRVRDTHDYLESRSVALGERFYTYDGDSARFPGDFSKVENVANCRCWLTYSKR